MGVALTMDEELKLFGKVSISGFFKKRALAKIEREKVVRKDLIEWAKKEAKIKPGQRVVAVVSSSEQIEFIYNPVLDEIQAIHFRVKTNFFGPYQRIRIN